VSLQQSNPLAFSEINIHTNGFWMKLSLCLYIIVII
jgi:hypothetical protein